MNSSQSDRPDSVVAPIRRAALAEAEADREEADQAGLRQRRAALHAHGLTSLLGRRPDLVGVHAWADLAVDAVRWGA